MSTPWKNLATRSAVLAGWMLNEAAGAVSYADYSGGGNSLYPAGAAPVGGQPGLLPGENDTSLYITGVNSQLNTGIYSGPILPASGGTVEAIFSASPLGNAQTLCTAGGGSATPGLIIGAAAGAGYIFAAINTASGLVTVTSTIPLSGQMQMAQAVYNGSTLTLYVDGVSAGSASAGNLVFPNPSYNFYFAIGTDGTGGGGGQLVGNVEKVTLYSTPLTAEVIADHWAYASCVTGIAPMTPWVGNTDIARRAANGRMRALFVADSIGVNDAAAFVRCFQPLTWTGFFGGLQNATDDINWGVQLLPQTLTGGGAAVDNGDLTSTFTETATTSPAASPASSTLLCYALLPQPATLAATMNAGSFIAEADAGNVALTAEFMIKGNASTGDGASFYASAQFDSAEQNRSPASGYIPASAPGWQKVNVAFPVGIPGSPSAAVYAGLRMPPSATMTAGKTIQYLNFIHITTGEIGFEFGSVALGGSSCYTWGQANGYYPDDSLQALCTLGSVDTFIISLGQNDALTTSAAVYSAISTLVARLRGFVPNASIIFFSSYETGSSFGNSRLAMFDAQYRAFAAADGNALYLDAYRKAGPYQKNYANAGGSSSMYYSNFLIGGATGTDPIHPSDIGRGRIGENFAGLLMTAAWAGDPLLQELASIAAGTTPVIAFTVTGDVQGKVLGTASGGGTITGPGALVNIANPQNFNNTGQTTAVPSANAFAGPNSVTLVFHDASNNPVPGVIFTVVGIGSAAADGAGSITFSLPAGTYTIQALPTAGTLWPDTSITVTATGTFTLTGTAIVIPPPASPNQTTAYLTTRDGQGNAAPGTTLTFQLIDPQTGVDAYNQDPFTATSNGSALLQVPLLQNAKYQARAGSGAWVSFTTGSATTFALPEIVGAE